MVLLKKSNSKSYVPLTMLKKGHYGQVVSFSSKDKKIVQKFAIFGILPGVTIEVVHNYPVYILKIDNTTVAIDNQLAATLYLKLQDTSTKA